MQNHFAIVEDQSCNALSGVKWNKTFHETTLKAEKLQQNQGKISSSRTKYTDLQKGRELIAQALSDM